MRRDEGQAVLRRHMLSTFSAQVRLSTLAELAFTAFCNACQKVLDHPVEGLTSSVQGDDMVTLWEIR